MKITELEVGKRYRLPLYKEGTYVAYHALYGCVPILCKFKNGNMLRSYQLYLDEVNTDDWIEVKDEDEDDDQAPELLAKLKRAETQIATYREELSNIHIQVQHRNEKLDIVREQLQTAKCELHSEKENLKEALNLLKEVSYKMICYYSERPCHDGFYEIGMKIKHFLRFLRR